MTAAKRRTVGARKPKPAPKPAAKRAKGRPPAYKPEFVAQARKLCKLGATDLDLSDFFAVTINTIGNWKTRYPDFLGALKAGKKFADDRVERSLYLRAVGYTHDAVKIFLPKDSRKPVLVPYREHAPPDTTAAIFWLKNRQPEAWRDRHEHTGRDGGPIQHQLDLTRLSDEQLAALEALVDTATAPGGDTGGAPPSSN